MNTKINYIKLKKFVSILLLFFLIFSLTSTDNHVSAGEKMIYPLKEISKLECRYQDFNNLSSSCKEKLPILKTKDYKKYIKLSGGYNKYTRLYTVLWGASYKYGWDIGNGGHIGTDIATAKGTPVYNIYDGKVIIAKKSLYLGNNISIEHKINGKIIVSNYAHLSKINVKKGQIIKVGKKIGEVGSTGNSTGNHLHFQIDFDTTFHPYYYDYKNCSYSYSKISETGVCFNELKKNTIDPLLFLETGGAILNNIKIEIISKNDIKTSTKKTKKTTFKKEDSIDLSIFDRTVYIGYDKNDIEEVQYIFRDLGEYKGKISGNYKDIENSIIDYQLANNLIETKTSLGAGRFGPKTRKQTKHDYENFLDHGGKINRNVVSNKKIIVKGNIKTQNISKAGLLSREEIESREVNDFTKTHKINLKLENIGGNIKVGETSILKLEITSKNGRKFKGNMPSGMTFTVDSTKLKVFPTKLYYFTDGKRSIKLTGLKSGNTTLYIKIGKKVIKSFKIKVYNSGKKITTSLGKIYTSKSIVLSDKKTGIVLFKDNNNKKLINLRYEGNYKLKTNEGAEICIKKGNLNDIKRIFKISCKDYKDEINFTYDDTIGGLLLFDYRVINKDAQIKLINNTKNKLLSTKNFIVKNPKGLKQDYIYKDEVITMLKQGVVEGINKGYFLEKRELVESDAIIWIKNTLEKMKEDAIGINLKNKIENNLKELSKLKTSKFNSISREYLLNLAYKYLVFDENIVQVSVNYRDLESGDNKKANAIFDKNNTWRDRFGENYYRPKVKITRGEGAYFLAKVLERNKKVFLTLR